MALEALCGAILNSTAVTQRERQRLRGVIANLATTVSFEEVAEGLETRDSLRKGFECTLRHVLRDVIVGDDLNPTPNG